MYGTEAKATVAIVFSVIAQRVRLRLRIGRESTECDRLPRPAENNIMVGYGAWQGCPPIGLDSELVIAPTDFNFSVINTNVTIQTL